MPLLSCKVAGLLRLSDSSLSKMKQSLNFMFLVRLGLMFSFFGNSIFGNKKITLCGIVDR